MHRRSKLLLAAGAAALSCACSSAPPLSREPDLSAEPDLATELAQLELSKPAPAQRLARPEDAGPHAFFPREIGRTLAAEVEVRDALGACLAREAYRLSPSAVSVTTPGGAEWWLARNPVAPQELHGARVDPAEHLVLEHSAGDLRLTGDELLWDRIAVLGFPGPPAGDLRPSGRVEHAHGLAFEQWLATDDAAPLRELWWNAGHALALRCVLRAGTAEVVRELVALDLDPDPADLRHPTERHPGFARSEISDWHDACGRTGSHRHGPGQEHADDHPAGESR